MECSLVSEGLAGQAASTGPRTRSCCCSCCKSARDTLGSTSVAASGTGVSSSSSSLSRGSTEAMVLPRTPAVGWGRQPAAHTEDHWQWLPLVAPLSGGVQERVRGACGKGHQQGWSFQVCTGCQNWTVWAVMPIFALTPLISQSGSRSVDCCQWWPWTFLPTGNAGIWPLLPISWQETLASCCCRVNCFSDWERQALLTSHPACSSRFVGSGMGSEGSRLEARMKSHKSEVAIT